MDVLTPSLETSTPVSNFQRIERTQKRLQFENSQWCAGPRVAFRIVGCGCQRLPFGFIKMNRADGADCKLPMANEMGMKPCRIDRQSGFSNSGRLSVSGAPLDGRTDSEDGSKRSKNLQKLIMKLLPIDSVISGYKTWRSGEYLLGWEMKKNIFHDST